MLKFLAISVIVLAILSFWLLNNKRMKTYRHYMKRKKWLEDSIKNFSANEQYINQNMAIAVNYPEKKLCLSVMRGGVPAAYIYDFNKIKGCEILEDEKPVKPEQIDYELNNDDSDKTSESALNKLITNTEKISRLDLKITIDDNNNPSMIANFLFSEVSKVSEDYRILFQDTLNWFKIINKIVEENN